MGRLAKAVWVMRLMGMICVGTALQSAVSGGACAQSASNRRRAARHELRDARRLSKEMHGRLPENQYRPAGSIERNFLPT